MHQTVHADSQPEGEVEPCLCPACRRPVEHRYQWGYWSPADKVERPRRVNDALYHLDATPAVNADGTVVCDGSGTCAHAFTTHPDRLPCVLCGAPYPSGGLDNQGRPVHGDQVPYHQARAELLGQRTAAT